MEKIWIWQVALIFQQVVLSDILKIFPSIMYHAEKEMTIAWNLKNSEMRLKDPIGNKMLSDTQRFLEIVCVCLIYTSPHNEWIG